MRFLICFLLLFSLQSFGQIISTTKTVTTAGTQLPITTTTVLATSLVVQANPANTGIIYVGDSGVDSSEGLSLAAGASAGFTMDAGSEGKLLNLNNFYLDSSVNGEGARIIYFTPARAR